MSSTPTIALSTPVISKPQQGDTTSSALRLLTIAMTRGDDEAWSQFHRAYGPAIFRQLLALTRGDDDLAKEALQRTYLRIAKHIRPCETELMFKSWLRTVARTALHDCWRRQRSFADLLFRKKQEPVESIGADFEDDPLAGELDQALARLEPADRALLEAKYFSARDVKTLAAELHLSPKAVESRLTRAREALRHELLAALRRHE